MVKNLHKMVKNLRKMVKNLRKMVKNLSAINFFTHLIFILHGYIRDIRDKLQLWVFVPHCI